MWNSSLQVAEMQFWRAFHRRLLWIPLQWRRGIQERGVRGFCRTVLASNVLQFGSQFTYFAFLAVSRKSMGSEFRMRAYHFNPFQQGDRVVENLFQACHWRSQLPHCLRKSAGRFPIEPLKLRCSSSPLRITVPFRIASLAHVKARALT